MLRKLILVLLVPPFVVTMVPVAILFLWICIFTSEHDLNNPNELACW